MDWPLALCNLSSIDEKDMKPVDVKYPSHTLESYRLCYNPNQRWGYFSKQEVNEILIFKSADSVVQGTGKEFSIFLLGCEARQLMMVFSASLLI